MRRGEGCGLRWSDIGWDAGTVRVDEAVVAADGGAVVRQPKTRASVRTLAIDAGTLAQLRELEAVQQQLATSCGMVVGPHCFVVSYEPGGALPPHPDTMSHGLNKLQKLTGAAADIVSTPSGTSTPPVSTR